MRRRRALLGLYPAIATLVALTLGCTPKRINSSFPLRGTTVPAGTKVMVLRIADGQERGEQATPGSGAAMERALREDLLAHALSPLEAPTGTNDDALQAAGSEGCRFVLRGTFTEWADNATQWSGNPDVAAFALEVVDPTSRRVVASASIRRRGSVWAITNESPTRFVPELAKGTLALAFGWPEK